MSGTEGPAFFGSYRTQAPVRTNPRGIYVLRPAYDGLRRVRVERLSEDPPVTVAIRPENYCSAVGRPVRRHILTLAQCKEAWAGMRIPEPWRLATYTLLLWVDSMKASRLPSAVTLAPPRQKPAQLVRRLGFSVGLPLCGSIGISQ